MNPNQEKELKTRLAWVIKALRGKKSQRQFAKETGISQSTVAGWELATNGLPSLDNIVKIAHLRGEHPEVLIAQLFGRKLDTPMHSEAWLEQQTNFELLILIEMIIIKLKREL